MVHNAQNNKYMSLENDFNADTDNSYYAKSGEPMYRAEMDSDNDGIVTYKEFEEYCRLNKISPKDAKDMVDMRMAYRMSQNIAGILKYEKINVNNDSKTPYNEYLKYCLQNARTEAKTSDTKIVKDSKNKFMTVSFGHVSNAYYRAQSYVPEGKIESNA